MSVDSTKLPVLKPGSRGSAVSAAKMGVNAWQHKTSNTTAWYGPFFTPKVKAFQKAHGLTADGVIGAATWKKLLPFLDARALLLLPKPPALTLCYPHPNVKGVRVGQGLHPTAGLPGSWAIDFMAPGGTAVLASCAATVTKLSGHDPKTGTHGLTGDVFGWSVYLKDSVGRTYYLTHLDVVKVKLGDKVEVGQRIGTVGHWPHDPGRSHTHEGCTAATTAQSKQRITDISKAPRLPAL